MWAKPLVPQRAQSRRLAAAGLRWPARTLFERDFESFLFGTAMVLGPGLGARSSRYAGFWGLPNGKGRVFSQFFLPGQALLARELAKA